VDSTAVFQFSVAVVNDCMRDLRNVLWLQSMCFRFELTTFSVPRGYHFIQQELNRVDSEFDSHYRSEFRDKSRCAGALVSMTIYRPIDHLCLDEGAIEHMECVFQRDFRQRENRSVDTPEKRPFFHAGMYKREISMSPHQ